MQMRRVFVLALALAIAGAARPALAQRNNDNNRRVDPDAQALADFIDLTLLNDPLVTGAAPGAVTLPPAGQAAPPSPPPNEIQMTWRANHFIKGQGGQTYVPFTIDVDRTNLPGKTVSLYVRVLNEEQAKAFSQAVAQIQKSTNENERRKIQMPAYAWNTMSTVELPASGPLQRAMLIPPGKYVAFVAIKERSAGGDQRGNNRRNNDRASGNQNAQAPPKMGLLRHELQVPDFSAADLKTSSVILATAVEPMPASLKPEEQEANPYVFGPMRVVPSLDGRFPKSGNLGVIFWIYGAGDAGGGKPDVTLEYNFHQRLPEGEKYFNKTQPQPVNASTLPPEFNVAAGHQLPGSLEVPLASFPAGDYRLEIKVTDKVTGKSVTENVNFTVVG